jgi:hypothetical protein
MEILYPRNRKYNDETREKEERELKIFKNNIGLTYDNLHSILKEDTNRQIIKLKSDVNRQYNEIGEIFNKLKMDVKEASQLKYEAERELNKIKEEIERKNETNLMYEEKLNYVLDKHAPHNNMHIPLEEVHPLYIKPTKTKHQNLKSTSTMVYANDEYIDEKEENKNRIKNYNKFSNLASIGQSLVGESEFVPIVNNSKNFKKYTEEIKDEGGEYEDRVEMGEMKNKSHYRDNLKNDYFDKDYDRDWENNIDRYRDKNLNLNDNFVEMYSKLNEISNLNNKMDPTSKYKTIGNNFDTDINIGIKTDQTVIS